MNSLSIHAYGCRVIQKILEFGNPEKVIKIKLLY